MQDLSMLLAHLIARTTRSSAITEAELARRLEVEPVRLYQWKTHRRKMPTKHLYKLAHMAGRNPVDVIGLYQIEWASAKSNKDAWRR